MILSNDRINKQQLRGENDVGYSGQSTLQHH